MNTHSTPPERTWHRAPLNEGPAGTNQTQWRAQGDLSPSFGPRYRSAGRILFIGLGLLVLGALLVWVSLWLRPGKDTALILIGAGYEDNLAVPHNVYGRQGLLELAALGREQGPSWGGGRLRLPAEPRQFSDIDGWDKDLPKIQQKTILLFFSAHGGVDGQGAYLLPNGALQPSAADPLEPDTRRLRLTRILDRLKRLKHRPNIVLVLDATQMSAHWPLGMLHNDFARELEKLEPQIADIPNLIVLSASAENQRSWVSPELRKTIFSHFIIKGLRGAADANDDGRVDAAELFRYVSAQVEEWVRRNRAAAQTPVLWPAGARGQDRARSIHLTIVTEDKAVALEKKPVFVAKPELVRAWQKFNELEQRRPAVYAPELWARYQQALLRYEELAQAGADAALPILGNRLLDLEQKILQAETLPLNSMQNSLAMPLVSGLELPAANTVLPAFTELWDAPAKELEKRWAALLAKAGPDKLSRQLLRLKLCDLLLERLNEAPSTHLDRVAALLGILDDPLNPRPAEAHFAVMLQRDLPPRDQAVPLPAELLRLALRVRIRAERAALGAPDAGTNSTLLVPKLLFGNASYVEQVQPWLRPLVAAADAKRRLGEDLLFATEAANWEAGRLLLVEADRLYQQAQERAINVRTALATRDRVLAKLPALTRWAARRMGQAETEAAIKDAEKLLEGAEQAWKAAHLLTAQLEIPHSGKAAVGNPQLLLLIDRGAEARAGLALLEQAYQMVLEEADRLPTQLAWRQLDDLLIVPTGLAKDRVELLVKKSRISYNLLNDREKGIARIPTMTDREKTARRTAEAQGRMAMAVLGERIEQQVDGKKGETLEIVARQLALLPLKHEWRPLATAAGAQIGRGWQGLPVEINLRLARAAKANSVQTLLELQGAERLARQLDAGGSLVVPYSPVEKYRKALVKELLLWQGERTLLDHWYAEDPAREPYYRAAGRLYLGDVGRHDAAKALQQRLNREPILQIILDGAPSLPKVASEPTLHVTSEETFPVRYRLQVQGEPAAPVGNPVVWVEPGENLTVGQPQKGWRLVMPGGTGLLPTTLTSNLLRQAEIKPPTKPVPVATSLTVRGLYRGQQLQQVTPIQLHPLAQTIVTIHPTPALASLAVRAGKVIHDQHGISKGAVAIVLDCSGSMGSSPGQARETSKFFEAAAAVRQLLQRIPRGTRLSLWVFGQAVGLTKTATRAEDTIEPLLPATTWNPDDGQAIEALMSRITALEPWNESPIARTMWRTAREHLDKADGYKTMIVITDGMDNRLDKDEQLNPQHLSVGTFLLENFKDIEVNVIGFRMVSQEEKQARQQFEVVTKLPNKGQFFQVEESRDLVIKMNKLLPQRLTYDLLLEDNRPRAALVAQGLTISRDPANDRWLRAGLKPNSYLLSLNTKDPAVQSVQLDPGDLLLLEVGANKAGRLGYRRLLFSESDYPWKIAREKSGWRLAVLQNQRVPPTGLQMLCTLEKKLETQGATLRQWTPAKTWIEVTPPADLKTPVSRRWHYQPGYPAPAWSLESAEWPGTPAQPSVRPTVRVWSAPDAPALVGNSLERGKNFQHLKDINDIPLTIESEQVIVESVKLERHLVETQPVVGDTANQRQSCLVVRLSHPASLPVWVELRGLTVKGQEHRYYSNAGKYTAIFWPVTPDQAATVLKGLDVYSLPAFKRDAEQRGFVMEIPNLYDPQASDVRPLPPLVLPTVPRSGEDLEGNASARSLKGPMALPAPRLLPPPVLTPQLQRPALTPLLKTS